MLLYFSNCPLYISSHAETQYSPGSERFPFPIIKTLFSKKQLKQFTTSKDMNQNSAGYYRAQTAA